MLGAGFQDIRVSPITEGPDELVDYAIYRTDGTNPRLPIRNRGSLGFVGLGLESGLEPVNPAQAR